MKPSHIMTFKEYQDLISDIDVSDYSALLNTGRKWKKIEDIHPNMRLAILGSASTQLYVSILRALLSKYDICADIYEGEYNGILSDILDDKSGLYAHNPQYIILLPDYRDMLEFIPDMLASEADVIDSVKKVTTHYLRLLNTIHLRLPDTQILLANFVVPFFDALGNLSANYLYSQTSFFTMVNLAMTKERPAYVTIVDLDGLASDIGKRNWFDESAYFLNKSAYSLQYIGYAVDLVARQFESSTGHPRKCLVLDLDNTLWGGVVGDLGYDKINLDPNDATGEAYLAFQKYLLELKQRGVILAVCSKNDEANAKEPFEKNEYMQLKLDDISCFVANWNDKASNIREIAATLNIGTDSLVFFDDNPTERALVREFLPEVRVIDVPEDPALYVRALDQAHAFEWTGLTSEDISRVQSYSANQLRSEILSSSIDYSDFLKKLDMHIAAATVNGATIARFTQLTNKSNQFNLCTRRYSEAEISALTANNSHRLLTMSMRDRFSNYGIIACVVLRFSDRTCFIENWVMSCRVLKKTVENYTISYIVRLAKKLGCTSIQGEYIHSAKNSMVASLYDSFGFSRLTTESDKVIYTLTDSAFNHFTQKYYFTED